MDYFDPAYMIVAVVTGMFGFAACSYGIKVGDLKTAIIGVAICAAGYFITNPLWLTGTCILLCIALFSTRIQYFIASRADRDIESIE